MRRFPALLCFLLLVSNAAAEAAPTTTPSSSLPNESQIQFDFSALTVDNPNATPIAVDPIDKPTPTPGPTPNFVYEPYTNQAMGISFNIPYTWLLNPSTNQDTTIQFVEPKEEMMEPDGYQTRVTIEKATMGLNQTGEDARQYLEQALSVLEQSFTSFALAGNIASASFAGCPGYYCYYRAEYNDGTKNYTMNGRIIAFAKGTSIYQIRLTAPRNWYTYYQWVYRSIRNSFSFI